MYTVANINSLPIIEIENFLSGEEADRILNTRKLRFEKARSHYPSYYRNNDRLEEDNEELAIVLFNKLRHFNIQNIKTKIIGINERIRFCEYQKDQLFSKHQDGVYYPNAKHQSKFTFLLYLNGSESFDAGETEFYNSKTDEDPIKTIIPKKGKLVIFDHQIWHKGAKVIRGNKYILRTDIIIERNGQSTNHDGYIWNLLKLNEEQFLSCGRDKKIKFWNSNLKLQGIIEIHSKSILKMIRLDQNEFVSCSRDFTIKKWNVSGKVLSSILLDEMILDLQCLENKQVIAAGTSGKVYVLSPDLEVLKAINIHNSWIWGISIIENNNIISCCEGGNVYSTNIISEETEHIYKHDQALFCVNTERNGKILIGSRDGTLIQLCIDSKKAHKIKVHNDIIRSIIYYNQNIITCGEDNKVILIDDQSYETKEIFSANNFMQDIVVLKDKIYAAGYDGVITRKKI